MKHDRDRVNTEPCRFCGYEFDHEQLGIYGCPNCEGDGLQFQSLPPADEEEE